MPRRKIALDDELLELNNKSDDEEGLGEEFDDDTVESNREELQTIQGEEDDEYEEDPREL